jgi:poly(3-hydroxybutyrate) depolymerase
MREAMRRRLRACTDPEKTACTLHHLAHVPLALTAEAMGTTEAKVSELCVPLSLGREVDYDTFTRQPETKRAVVRPPRRRRSSLPMVVGVAAVIAGALIVLASMDGERPTVVGESADATSDGADNSTDDVAAEELVPAVSSDVVPVPSAGCSAANAGALVDPDSDDVDAQPMLVVLPGFSQTQQEFADTAGLGLLAGEAVLVGVDPDPVDQEFNTRGIPTRRNDLAAVMEATDAAIAENCVDLARVHLVGMGSGGQMAGLVACSNPDVFATVSMVSGWTMPDGCRLDPRVSALFIANTGDPVVSVSGGFGQAALDLWANPDLERTDPEPLADVTARWATAIGADPLPGPSTEGTTSTSAPVSQPVPGEPGEPPVAPSVDPPITPIVDSSDAEDGAAVQVVLNPVDTHDWQPSNIEYFLHFIKDHARGMA